MAKSLLFDIQLILSAGLLVLIWIIQVLHYPSFSFYEKSGFHEAMMFHQSRITYIVAPLMIAELFLSLYLFAQTRSLMDLSILGLVLVIWASTFFLQVPIHGKLGSYNLGLINQLTATNWIRTMAWTVKFGLVFWQRFQ